ncbi:MAG: hypothetical protein ABH896_03635 [Candidatus Jacksonbacteria bacterium]
MKTTPFHPEGPENPLFVLSQKFNRQAPKEQAIEEKNPLIRLAKKLNVNPKEITPEKATPAIDGKTANGSVEYPTDKQKTLDSQPAKTTLVNLLSEFNKEQITEYLKNNCRLSIEKILKSITEIARLTNNSSLLITSSDLYKKLNNAEHGSKEMYQTGEEIAGFTTNSLIPCLEGLNLEAVSDHRAKKNIQTELAKIAELIEELESVK